MEILKITGIKKFYTFNLDLRLMTLTIKLDLDIVKMYSRSSGSKVTAWTDRQTDTHTHGCEWKHCLSHKRMINKVIRWISMPLKISSVYFSSRLTLSWHYVWNTLIYIFDIFGVTKIVFLQSFLKLICSDRNKCYQTDYLSVKCFCFKNR